MTVAETIRHKLTARFAPSRLDIVAVTIVSASFSGLGRVARQRMVYEALADELRNRVHALALTTRAPGEDERKA
jgi:BolA protein